VIAVFVEKSASGRFFCFRATRAGHGVVLREPGRIHYNTDDSLADADAGSGLGPGGRKQEHGNAGDGVVRTLQRETNRMRFIVWLLRALVFIVLLVLALANTQNASLNFAGYAWQAPLILIGLVFFAVGLFAGVLAAAPALVRMRLENGRLRRQIKNVREVSVVVDEPPLPPII
jgi:uncharacterized integral membrane protein